MKKKLLCFVLVFIFCLAGIINVSADNSIIASGTCKDNGTWQLYDDGRLMIQGTGVLSYCNEWEDLCDDIKEIHVENGITEIKGYTFKFFDEMEDVFLPNSVKKLHDNWLYCCRIIKAIHYDGTAEEASAVITGATLETGHGFNDHIQIYYSNENTKNNSTETTDKTTENTDKTTELSLEINAEKTDKSELDAITYDSGSGTYNIDSFMLTGELVNKNFIADIPAVNVEVKITLPEGFTFKSGTNAREKVINYNKISTSEYFNETVYLNNPAIGKNQGKISVSADNTDKNDYTFDLDVTSGDFEVNKYRADYILKTERGQNAAAIEKTFTSDTPASIFYENGKRNNLNLSVNFWDAIQNAGKLVNNPTKAIDVTLEKKDMYEALLWNIFESSCTLDLIDEMDAAISDSSKDVYDGITKHFKEIYNIDLAKKDSFKNMTSKQKKAFTDELDNKFSAQYGGLNNVMTLSDFISDMTDAVSDTYTVCKAAATYYMMYALNDSIKEVMKEMSRQCPSDNLSLKAALLNCTVVMDSNEKQFLADIAGMVTLNTGKFAVQACVGKLWSSLKTKITLAHPGVAVFMLAYEGSTFVSNTLFNTDAISESYSKLEAICDIKAAAYNSYNALKKVYIGKKTEFNAQVYNSAIDIMYSVLNEDCKASTEFVDSYEETLDGSIRFLFGDTTTTERKDQINSIQTSYSQAHAAVLRDWLLQLEEDNPKEYEKYTNMLNKSADRAYKKYEIACPVDVYVYDENNQLAGSVKNNAVYVNEDFDISIATEKDKKIIYLSDDSYNLKYVGSGNGSMDIKISEYRKGDIERNVYFTDIPLKNGTEYTLKSAFMNRVWPCDYKLKGKPDTYIPDFDTYDDTDNAVFNEILSALNIEIEEIKTSFDSKVSEWAKEEVEEAYKKGLIPESLIGQDLTKTISRAEFADLAVKLYEKMSGKKAKEGQNSFDDIRSHSLKSEILKAYNLGITQGISEDEFAPDYNISREQLSTMLCRAVKKVKFNDWSIKKDSSYILNTDGVSKFSDDGDISDFAKESVYFMAKHGIIKGIDNSRFAPKNITSEQIKSNYADATREQSILISLRCFKALSAVKGDKLGRIEEEVEVRDKDLE